jgi:hypothetical protein
MTATAAMESSVRVEPQPTDGASTTVKTRSSMAAVRLSAPARSNERETPALFLSDGTSLLAATRAARATGAGRKKTQRQPISVSRPPKTSPSEKPVAPVAV